ncbi:MAG: hypothetical protein V7K35_00395 [Nostoc sp.]|uniref:hypothetical protein n=1 Tax=Nostoc sp. TaxID=1180 RepID=UPI002FF52F11
MNATVIAANEYAFIANAQTVVANIPIFVTSASIFGTNGQAIGYYRKFICNVAAAKVFKLFL